MLAACLQLSARTVAQRVTISERNTTLKKIFQDIKKQTSYQFFYQDELLQRAKNVRNIYVKNLPLDQVLDLCFAGQPLTYEIVEKTITVKALKGIYQSSFVVQNEIHGRVTDTANKPLSGVYVQNVNSRKGVVTDENGEYSINANVGDVLEFTYVGFTKQRITVSSVTPPPLKCSPTAAAIRIGRCGSGGLWHAKENRPYGFRCCYYFKGIS